MAQLGEDNWDSQKTSSDNDTKLKTLVPFQFSPAIPYDETFELLEREQPQVSFEPQWLKRNQENTLTGGKPYNVSKVWPAAKYQYTKEELLTLFKPTEFSEDSSLNSFLTLVTKECTPPFNLLPIEQQEESINKINASAGRGRFPNSRGFVNRSMSSDSAITNNAPTSPFSNNNNNRGRGRGRGRPDMNNMNNNNNNNAFTNSPLSFSSDRIQDNNNNRYKHPWSDRQQRGDNNNNNNSNIKTTPMRHPTRTGNTNDSWGSNSNNKGPLFDRSGGNQFKRENKIRRPLKELLWLYRDPQGEIQGPFTDSEMNEWFEAGYFTPNLLIKRVYQSYFVELSTLPLDLNLSPFFTLDDDILTPSSSSSSTTSDINDSSTIIKQNDVDSDSVIDDLHLNKPNYNKNNNNNNNKDNVTTPTTKSQSLVNIEIIGQVHNTTPLLKNSNIIISNNNNNSNNSVPITHSVSSPVVLTTSSSIATANANINNIAINNNVTGVANSNNSTTVTNSNINIKEQDPAIIAASPAQIHMMLLRQQQQQQMAMGMGMGMNPQMMNQHIPHDIIPPHHIIHQHHDVHIAENELLNERFGFINPNPMQNIPIPMQQQQQQMVNNTTGTAVQPPLNAWHRPPVVLPYQPVQPLLPNNNNNPTTSTANTVAPPNNNTNVNNPIAQQQQQQYPLKRNQGVFLLDESGMIRNVPSAPVPLPTTTATPVVNPINTSNSSIPISSPVQESTNSNTQQPQEEEEFFWQTDNNTTATTHGNAVEVNNSTENKVEKTWNQKPQKQEPVSIKAIQDQEKQEKQKKQKQQTNQVQSPNKPITPQAQQAATIPINNSNSGNVGWNNTTNTSSTKTLREIQEEEKRQSEIARLEKQKQQEQNAKLKKAKEDKERIVPLSSTGGWSSTNATGVNTNVANNNNETPILSLREIQEQEKQQLKKQREMEAKQEMKKQVQQQTQNTQPRWGAGWTANDNKKPTLREIQEEELKHKTTDAPTPIPLNKTQEIAPPLTWANQPKPVPEPIPSANTPVTNITNNNNKNKKSPMKKESELPTKKEAPKQQQKQATPTKTSKKEEKKPVATAWGATQSSNQSKSLKDIQQEELQKATALNTTVTPPVVENKDKDAYFWDIPEEDHKTNVTPAPSTTPRKSNATDNKDFPALQASKKNTNVVASQPAVVSQTQTTKAEQSKQKKKKNQKLPASLLGFTVYNPNQGEIETLED